MIMRRGRFIGRKDRAAGRFGVRRTEKRAPVARIARPLADALTATTRRVRRVLRSSR